MQFFLLIHLSVRGRWTHCQSSVGANPKMAILAMGPVGKTSCFLIWKDWKRQVHASWTKGSDRSPSCPCGSSDKICLNYPGPIHPIHLQPSCFHFCPVYRHLRCCCAFWGWTLRCLSFEATSGRSSWVFYKMKDAHPACLWFAGAVGHNTLESCWCSTRKDWKLLESYPSWLCWLSWSRFWSWMTKMDIVDVLCWKKHFALHFMNAASSMQTPLHAGSCFGWL